MILISSQIFNNKYLKLHYLNDSIVARTYCYCFYVSINFGSLVLILVHVSAYFQNIHFCLSSFNFLFI